MACRRFASSCGVAIRSSGFFRSNCEMMSSSTGGVWGAASRTGRGVSNRTRSITGVMVPPLKGGLPVNRAYKTQPRLYRSLRGVAGLPSTCSGDM